MARSLALRFVPPISFVLAASAGDDIGPSAYRQVGAPRRPERCTGADTSLRTFATTAPTRRVPRRPK